MPYFNTLNESLLLHCQQLQLSFAYRYFLKMMQAGKQNRMSRVSLPQLEGGTLEEYMEVLYAHQKNCQKTGKYMQAQTAKRRLVKVKEQLQKQRKEELLMRFAEEKRQVDMAHLQEITQFNKYWDEKLLQYHTEGERMEGETIDRHEKELIQFQQEIQASLCQGRRETGEIINLRKIEENLAKQEKYIEAHKVQRQIQALEKAEFQKWNHAKSGKMKNLMSQLRSKQENQLNALRQKIEQGFQQQKKTRQTEQEKLIQKYQNFLKQLQNQHHQEIIKFQKSTKLQSTMNFSRASTMSRALQNRNN